MHLAIGNRTGHIHENINTIILFSKFTCFAKRKYSVLYLSTWVRGGVSEIVDI